MPLDTTQAYDPLLSADAQRKLQDDAWLAATGLSEVRPGAEGSVEAWVNHLTDIALHDTPQDTRTWLAHIITHDPPSRQLVPCQSGGWTLLGTRLGAGGFGTVHEGRTPDGRTVAVKVLHASRDVERDAAARARLAREGRLLRQCDTPGIPRCFESGPDYLVIERIAGLSWHTLLRCRQTLDVHHRRLLASQATNTLANLHAASIVHGDVKPANLLVGRDRHTPHELRAWLIDFGLARTTQDDADHVTCPGMLVGTPAYLDPRLRESSICRDATADVYSLGLTLAEWEHAPTATVERMPHPDPRTHWQKNGPRQSRSDRIVRELVAAMLEPTPAKRPSAAEAATTLCRLTRGYALPTLSTHEAISVSHVIAALQRQQRRRLWPVLAVLSSLTIGTALSLPWWATPQATSPSLVPKSAPQAPASAPTPVTASLRLKHDAEHLRVVTADGTLLQRRWADLPSFHVSTTDVACAWRISLDVQELRQLVRSILRDPQVSVRQADAVTLFALTSDALLLDTPAGYVLQRPGNAPAEVCARQKLGTLTNITHLTASLPRGRSALQHRRGAITEPPDAEHDRDELAWANHQLQLLLRYARPPRE